MDIEQQPDLQQLIAAADHLYAIKNFEEAAEKYSNAASLQEQQNGEMNPANADLLYAYGRCLYQVAVQKSDVLGGKVAGERDHPSKPKSNKRKRGAATQSRDAVAEDTVEEKVEPTDQQRLESNRAHEDSPSSKPFFQISGDGADWDSSEEEDDDVEADEDGANQEQEEGEEDDDLETAYEVLDVARVLLSKKIENIRSEGTGKTRESQSSELRKSLEKLADTRDQQAEICLENERFADAIEDARASLELKKELYEGDSSLIAEAHFKLSLALEFASTSYLKTDGAPAEATSGQTVDEGKREEAAIHMQAAIDSSQLRVKKQEEALESLDETSKEKAQQQIADVKEMIVEMETRLEDLRNPAVDMQSMLGPVGAPGTSNSLGGILGSVLGESESDQKARLQEATQNANDLTSMVKKKKPKMDDHTAPSRKRAPSDACAANTKGKKARAES